MQVKDFTYELPQELIGAVSVGTARSLKIACCR